MTSGSGAPEREPVPRAREPSRWLSSITFLGLVAAGVVAAAVLLWRTVDVRELLDPGADGADPAEVRSPGLAPRPPASTDDSLPVALLVSPESRPFFGEAGYYDSLVAGWARTLRSLGAATTRVRRPAEVAALDSATTVVVPAAPCLAFKTGQALYGHLRRGGGVVVEGPVGSRDQGCGWRGWSLLRSLTAARSVGEVGKRGSLYLTVPEVTPLSHGSVPGARIELAWDHQVAVRVDGPAPYWSDWGLSPVDAAGGDPRTTGAVAARTEDGGRIVWFGFLAPQAAGKHDARRVERLHRAGVLWAAARPVASLAPWPGGDRAALLITEDVESEPQNARVVADLLADRGLPGTFFVVSDLVRGQDGLGQRLVGAGEIGTHTFDHRTLAGASLDDQVVRLRRSRRTAAEWAGTEVTGLRPPEERFDRRTLRAWSRVGGAYVAAENRGRSAAPELHAVPGSDRPMVVLPRMVKDDYNLLVMEGKSWTEALPDLLESVRRVHRLGGLALVNLHTQLIDMGRAEELGAAVDSLRAWEGWWTASAGRVASWWRARHAARLRLDRRRDGDELVLRLAAPADTPLVEATVRVHPGTPAEAWSPEPGAPARVGRSAGRLDVVVDSVPAGDSVAVRLLRSRGAGAAGGEGR